jgi:opacity protein-like surface antigen
METFDRGIIAMKRSVFLCTFLVFLSAAYTANGQGKTYGLQGLYFGVSGAYALENMDVDHEGTDVGLNIDNSFGIHLKVGYRVNNTLSFEGTFDYLPGFDSELSDSENLGGLTDVKTQFELDVKALMASVKASFNREYIIPYLTMGVGMMSPEAKMVVSGREGNQTVTVTTDAEIDTDYCAKFGLGIDYFVREYISIGLEGHYTLGFGDLENVKYVNLMLGTSVYF